MYPFNTLLHSRNDTYGDIHQQKMTQLPLRRVPSVYSPIACGQWTKHEGIPFNGPGPVVSGAVQLQQGLEEG